MFYINSSNAGNSSNNDGNANAFVPLHPTTKTLEIGIQNHSRNLLTSSSNTIHIWNESGSLYCSVYVSGQRFSIKINKSFNL